MSATTENLLRGTLDMVILKSLTWGARHGYAITEWIQAATGGELLIEEGTLYPALHRLEKKGFVEAEWGLSEKNRKAKYYQLTSPGEQQLTRETKTWQRYAEAITRAMSFTAQTPV